MTTATVSTQWFHFSQNNSGGDFHTKFGHHVVIEAMDDEHANSRAEHVGLYFDGCDEGRDCSCCGDRWHRAWGNDGDKVPSVYGQPVNEPDADSFGGMFSGAWKDGKDIQVVPLEGEPFFMARGDALPEPLASRVQAALAPSEEQPNA